MCRSRTTALWCMCIQGEAGRGGAGECFGVSLTTDADVSFVPEAEGESVGVSRCADRAAERIEGAELSAGAVSKPQAASADEGERGGPDAQAAEPVAATTGYTLTLDSLKLHSMLVEGQVLDTDLDADIGVN